MPDGIASRLAKVRGPFAAYKRFRAPFDYAVSCLTDVRLEHPNGNELIVGRDLSFFLGRRKVAEPVKLPCEGDVWLSMGQWFRIVETDDPAYGSHRVQTTEYWYQFATNVGRGPDKKPEGDDILTSHWTPEVTVTVAGDDPEYTGDTPDKPRQKDFPHLHIGSSILQSELPVANRRFHLLHVPTMRLSIETIVRFAIDELGVKSRNPDWREQLATNDALFEEYRRPGKS